MYESRLAVVLDALSRLTSMAARLPKGYLEDQRDKLRDQKVITVDADGNPNPWGG